VFIFVAVVYFVIDSVRKLLDTPSCNSRVPRNIYRVLVEKFVEKDHLEDQEIVEIRFKMILRYQKLLNSIERRTNEGIL